jgi:hypothetical protein
LIATLFQGAQPVEPVADSRPTGQPLDTRNPRALFVLLCEARETFAALDAVADDATRPPGRRKLTRAEARRRYEAARAGLAWRLALDLGKVVPEPSEAPSCASDGPRFECWAE